MVRFFDTLDVSFPVGATVACAVILAVSWLLAEGLRKAGPPARAIATAICAAIIVLVALSAFMVTAYPGPVSRYAPGSAIHWAHVHALGLGSYLAMLIPFCAAALVAALRPNGGRLTTIVAVALSALLIVPSLVLVLVVACSHAGACL